MNPMKALAEVPSGDRLLALWEKFQKLPAGAFLFSKLLVKFVPYTGTIKPRIVSLGKGHACVEVQDRPLMRNHLKSIHAMALANIAEMASGLAMMSQVPDGYRGILTHFEIDYLKKARGKLIAESEFQVPVFDQTTNDYHFPVEVRDEQGQIVVRAQARWRIGPVQPKSAPVSVS